jgi:hypothetical protein
MMRRLFLSAVIAFVLLPFSANASDDQSPGVMDNAGAAWDLFHQGCILHNQDLVDWTTDKNYLIQSRAVTPSQMIRFSKLFLYPGDQEPAQMWNLHNSYVTLVHYENQDCAVVSDTYVPPEAVQDLAKNLSASLSRLGERVGTIQTHIDENHNGFYVLLPVKLAGSVRLGYVMIRTFPDGMVTHLKTMFYFFQPQQSFSFATDAGIIKPVQ